MHKSIRNLANAKGQRGAVLKRRCRFNLLAKLALYSGISAFIVPTASATDLEIYSQAQGGLPVITLMLDRSESMNLTDIDSECTSRKREYKSEYGFFAQYCEDNDGKKYYRGIDNLKMGVIDLVNNPALEGRVKIGIGIYPNSEFTILSSFKSGSIKKPAKILDTTHRNDIVRYVKGLTTSGNTPTAQAYAEVGAYMMGTHTKTGTTLDVNFSGFSASASATKEYDTINGLIKRFYKSPINPNAMECAAGAVYFLTDGIPNESTSEAASAVMSQSLKPREGDAVLSTTCEGDSIQSWDCILDYAGKLLDDRNPITLPIKTATVGYGQVFKSLENVQTIEDCDSGDIDSEDAKNLCKWGFKGQGGFYFAENSNDIVSSLNSLLSGLNNDIPPISTGTMSIPLDNLSTFKSRKLAYVPILDPKLGESTLWPGNLKKYNVVDATIKGVDNDFVFKDEKGQFATNTWDIWNTIIDPARATLVADTNDEDDVPNDALKPDQGLPQVGGTYQKVFENATSGLANRNLFVNSNGKLVNLKVVQNKPLNFDLLLQNQYDNNHKLNLLHFMGYEEPDTTEVKDNTALTASFDKWRKNVGGVLHSVPQLVTTEVELDAQGKFIDNTRKDYLIYGSMDGALHLVDDKTGTEVFTFVPKQLLDLQPAALTSGGTTLKGRFPYGVDAPWATYSNYNVTTNVKDEVTTNLYKAEQVFAMGGLRMGGSMYYALDISDIDKPKLIYNVGSTYANSLEGETDGINGIQDDAFARMGQTWAKPSTGYVKSGGKKVMVNFLPGGYDECYEDAKFKLNQENGDIKCSAKAQAQGNAMYMVQVGEVTSGAETIDDQEYVTQNSINTSTNNGKLLWWASNTGSSTTTPSSELQYTQAEDLKHSIVTQVRMLDRNSDGLTDHIYFADLGGQVWRADINNNAETANFKVDRVVKILDVSDQASGEDAPPRFYERPMVTFYNGTYAYAATDGTEGNNIGPMALVTVGTGDRSNPTSATRNVPNAIYNIIDKDVTRVDLFNNSATGTTTLPLRTDVIKVQSDNAENSNILAKLTFSEQDIGNEGIKAKMRSNQVQGWYMPLDYWLDNEITTDTHSIKMFNEPDALAGILITSSYNPNAGDTAIECSAGVIGLTQRERTCLPYGVCGDEVATTRAQSNAGIGIVDNIITQYNDTPIFASLQNYCEGDNCLPTVICKDSSCETILIDDDDDTEDPQNCTGIDCDARGGVNTDQRINPLAWMEY